MLNHNDAIIFDKLSRFLPAHLAKRLQADMNADDAQSISKHLISLRRALSTYLPHYLVEKISKDPKPGQVNGYFRHGVVLFADVSGFTAMSEELSALGREGAEEVTSIVNDYFETMLKISNSYGGDLLKFGGDALLIFFEGQDSPQRALATGSAMQKAMSSFAQIETSQGTYPLRMKIGMANGPIFLVSLGTSKNMDYAVMGRTLSRMAQAEGLAQSGQIVGDQEVYNATGNIAIFKPIDDNFWLLRSLNSSISPIQPANRKIEEKPIPADTHIKKSLQEQLKNLRIIEGLCPYIPDELLTSLIIDPQRPIQHGSHRQVTVMFANFYGIDKIIDALGPGNTETITEILNLHYTTMSEIITRYGGTVNRLDSYAIGYRILALFGALRAHEDDPHRAVHAALEMNRSLEKINQQTRELLANVPNLEVNFSPRPLKQRIGINSGFVFAGNTGSDTRREYTVMGEQVNLTARLMSVAGEGEVLIGESTARRIESAFHLEEKEAVKVKGITHLVRNFHVAEGIERPQWKMSIASGPMVGRANELSQGKQAVKKALIGEGCVLVIKGVSGIGKTRLAEEIALYAESVGMDLLVGSCLSYGNTMTYHPWAEILRAYFDIRAIHPTESASSRLKAINRGMKAIDEELWTPIIGTVLGLELPDNELTRDLDAQLRRQRVLDLTIKLLQARAQRQPLLVVVEDAHWADPASMDLIGYTARNIIGHPVLLILLHRLDQDLPDWSTYPHAIEITLDDLPEGACTKIVQNIIGPLQFPEPLLKTIHRKACGNPFFIGEVVRALIDAGVLQRDNGSWQLAEDISSFEIPDTIHGIIISRIDRLLATDRQILQVASVVGRVFAYQTLIGVNPYSDIGAILRQRLNYLNELGLTDFQNIELEIYRFIHLTTQEVVYESLSFELRRGLHRNIGSFIERTFSATLSEQTDLLAHHYFEGQVWDKAMEFNLKAGRHAQQEFANDTAITAYQRVLISAGKLGSKKDTIHERLSVHESLGEVLTLVGRYEQALGHYRSSGTILENLPQSPEHTRHLAGLCRKTAEVFEKRSEYETSFEWLAKGLDLLQDKEPTIEHVNIYLMMAGLYHRQGQNDETILWCQNSQKAAANIHTRQGRQAMAQAYYLEGAAHYRLGELQDTLQLCQKSIQIYQQAEDILGEARAYTNLSNAYADQGEWDLASDALKKSLVINQKIGNIHSQGIVANNLAYIYLDRGDWDQAMDLFEQSNAIWRKLGATLHEAITLSNMAQVHIYQENWSEARQCLNQSQLLFAKTGSEDYLPEVERRWGEYFLKTAQLDQALNHIKRSIELAAAQEARLELGISFRVLGEVHLGRGELDEASIALKQSLRILNDLNSEYEAAKTMLSLTRLEYEAGELVDNRRLEQAIQIFEKLEARADLGRSQELTKQLDSSHQ
jgi:class 3 adenylate cyclase/predicted ATPase